MKKTSVSALITIGLFSLAFLVRIWAAWAFQYDVHHDRGRTLIMTQHIAQGVDFPVFGYGAPHLGSLEPAFSALIGKVTGMNSFTTSFGTILLSMFLLLTVYLWTRRAAGPSGAVPALAFLLIGPFGFFVFTVLPRGGYAVTMLLGVSILFLTGEIATRERKHAPAPLWMFWLLGTLCGLAWWTHQILISALVTAAIWLMVTYHFRILSKRIISALIFFFVFSAPWWIWNFFNHWETLTFIPSFYGSSLTKGLSLFAWDRLFSLINMPASWGPLRYSIPLLYALILLTSIGAIVHAYRMKDSATLYTRIHPQIAITFLALYALFFAKSSFALVETARYVIPAIPIIAFLIGYAFSELTDQFARRRSLAIIPLVLLITGQLFAFFPQASVSSENKALWQDTQHLGEFCKSNKVEVVFVNRWQNWMNYAAEEQVVFCDFLSEPYAPYEKAGNQAQEVAVLKNALNLQAFLEATQASCSKTNVGSFHIMYHFTNAPQPAAPLPASTFRRMTDGESTNLLDLLTDQDCDTSWKAIVTPTNSPQSITCTFAEPSQPCGIRMWCNREKYPARCLVEGRSKTNADWQTLLPEIDAGPYFWSGPRWYANGLFYRMMYRFSCPDPIQEMRITFNPAQKYTYPVDLAELQILGSTDPIPTANWNSHLPALASLIKKRNIMRCFADRWLSAQLQEATTGSVEVIEPSFMKRSVYSGEQDVINEYVDIERLSPNDAMAVSAADAENLDTILKRHSILMRKTSVGPWVLFDFATGQYTRSLAMYPGLKWIGYGCIDNREKNLKHKGHYYYLEAMDSGDADKKTTYLKQAVHLYPRHKAALEELVEHAAQSGQGPLSRMTRHTLASFVPEMPLSISYENKIRLIGITPRALDGFPGQPLAIDYFWECPPDVNPEAYAVFVHISKNGDRFQDDHVFLEGVSEQMILQQLTPETFITCRSFPIPLATPIGEYSVVIGLYNRHTGFRMRPRTKLRNHRKGVMLPITIHVLNPALSREK